MTGSETGHDLTVKQAVELPDGSGYDLVTGEYKSGTTKDSVVAMRGSVR
jgi:hypothetical protein